MGLRTDTEDNGPDPNQTPIVNQTKGSKYLTPTSFRGLQMICPPVISGQVGCEKSGILSTPQQISGETGQPQAAFSSRTHLGYESVCRDGRFQDKISEALTFQVASKAVQLFFLMLSYAMTTF